MGVMQACFHLGGTFLLVILTFIRCVMIGINTGRADLIIRGENPSSPDAVCMDRDWMIFFVISVSFVNCSTRGLHSIWDSVTTLVSTPRFWSRVGPISIKKWFKISAFCVGSYIPFKFILDFLRVTVS